MWEKDRLDRKKYADFLYTLISNSDKYKRAEGEDAYVMHWIPLGEPERLIS